MLIERLHIGGRTKNWRIAAWIKRWVNGIGNVFSRRIMTRQRLKRRLKKADGKNVDEAKTGEDSDYSRQVSISPDIDYPDQC